MKHRKLRIAWSVAWGIVAILLILMEERSYRTTDAWTIGRGLYVASADGDFAVGILAIPYWLALAISITFAAVPWIRWSNCFSLHTLLVATALIAVVLGAAVWLARG